MEYGHLIQTLPVITNNEIVSLIKDNKDIILFYLSSLVERKCPYIYWPIYTFDHKSIIFTNAKNDDKKYKLIKSFTPDMIVKVLSIYNEKHWNIINTLLKIFSNTLRATDEYIYNNIYVFRINIILSYLKKIDFNISHMDTKKNIFNTIYYEFNSKKELLSYIERDVTVTIKLKQLTRLLKARNKLQKYKTIYDLAINEEWIGDNIQKIEVELDDNKYHILLEPKTHLLTPKLYKHIKQTYFNDNLEELQKNYNIVFIHDIENYRYLYYSRLVTKDFELISSYPYVMLYDRNSKKEVLENEGKENNE